MKGSMIVWKSDWHRRLPCLCLFDLSGRLHIAAVFGLIGRFYQSDLLTTARV